jgi:SAM-dependent methyltransferase
MIKRIRDFIDRQQFYPSLWGVFFNPFYFARVGLHDGISDFAPKLHGRLLDIGCGTKPYKELFTVDEYIGLDIDSENSRTRGIADYFYDGNSFPFENESFDAILCSQVLEHVFNPEDFLNEINRVLRPGGKALFTVPFVWDEHEQPHDYARYSTFGLTALFEKNNFNTIDRKKTCDDITVIAQLLNAYIYKVSDRYHPRIKALICISIMAPISLISIALAKVLPSNPDLFLDHIILAEKT